MANTPSSDESNQNDQDDGKPYSGESGELGPLNTPLRKLLFPKDTPSLATGEGAATTGEPETALTMPIAENAALAEAPGEGEKAVDAEGTTETAAKSQEASSSEGERHQESGRKGNYRRAEEEYSSVGLRQRRAEDERMTGRHWPGNGIVYPGGPHEAQFFEQLAIAFGEANPRTLARESAMRYVRSSRVPGEDELSPTDIYAIVYYGLGLTVRPLDCSKSPQTLALYYRATHDIYIDWKLLQDPPFGRVTLDPSAWRRSVDGSAPARFLLAWCAAVHLTENYDLPLMLGFTPHTGGMPAGPLGRGSISLDTLNRYGKAVNALTTLLAPEERLWRQIAALGLSMRAGDPQWRERLRTAYGYVPGNAEETKPDPVTQLIAALAERNNCPPLLIEAQLSPTNEPLDWGSWSARLLDEIPELQLRFASAARLFHFSNERDLSQGAPEVRPIHIQLSL